jgi:hypothetical protein
MPKNTKGGKGAKKGKNSSGKEDMATRIIVKPDDSGMQHFAILEKFFGATSTVAYIDTKGQVAKTSAFIRGAVLKRCKKYFPGDIVLICEREFEKGKPNAKVDLVHKYFQNDVLELKKRRAFSNEFISLLESYALVSDKGENDIKKAYADYGNDTVRFAQDDFGAAAGSDDETEPAVQAVMQQPNRDFPPSSSEDEEEEDELAGI